MAAVAAVGAVGGAVVRKLSRRVWRSGKKLMSDKGLQPLLAWDVWATPSGGSFPCMRVRRVGKGEGTGAT